MRGWRGAAGHTSLRLGRDALGGKRAAAGLPLGDIMPITDWPDAERPRERLLRHGPARLSDTELLAIFLRTGVAGQTAVDIARALLVRFGGISGVLAADRAALSRQKG